MYGPEKRQCLDSFAKAFCFGIPGGERKEPSDGGCVIRLDGSLISTVDMFECQVLDMLDMLTPCKPLSKMIRLTQRLPNNKDTHHKRSVLFRSLFSNHGVFPECHHPHQLT